MNSRKLGRQALAALALLCLCICRASAQAKPPESSTKVKKVLLYNKVGGWVIIDGIAAIKAAFSQLSATKGFELVQLDSEAAITLDYLKQFQVIVWNNNTNGGSSVPSVTARQAILEYLHQGGGWLLIHGAGQNSGSWLELAEALGTDYLGWNAQGQGEVVLDNAGRAHKELKWMVQGFPETFPLVDLWMTFKNTVRPLPGVTVVATSRGAPSIVRPIGDKSGDNVYLWAREVGKGRLFYNAIGFGQNKLMEQQDSLVPRLYWENLRYAAGDYQNGCLDPSSPAFDPSARVHSDALCPAVGLVATPGRTDLEVSMGARKLRLPSPEGSFRILIRGLDGRLVREWSLPAGTREITLGQDLKPGVYHVELRGTARSFQRRLALP